MNVEAITLQSCDPGRLAEFYCAAFDLGPPRIMSEDHLGLSIGEFYVGIDKVDIRPYGGGAMTLWIMVPDAEWSFNRLIEMGADLVQPPDADSSPGEVLAMVADPEGNRIGLISRRTAIESGEI